MAVDVLLGRTYDDARAYALANPLPPGTRLVSASAHPKTICALRVGRIYETPAAQLAPAYRQIRAVLEHSASRYAKPLT
jgi:hypothetical protein